MLDNLELPQAVDAVKHDIYLLLHRAVRLLNKDLTKLDSECTDQNTQAAFTIIAYVIYLQDLLEEQNASLEVEFIQQKSTQFHKQYIESLTAQSYEQKKAVHEEAQIEFEIFIKQHNHINFEEIDEAELEKAYNKVKYSSKLASEENTETEIDERTRLLAEYCALRKSVTACTERIDEKDKLKPTEEMKGEIFAAEALFLKINNERKRLVNFIAEKALMRPNTLDQCFQLNSPDLSHLTYEEMCKDDRKEASTQYSRLAQEMTQPLILSSEFLSTNFRNINIYVNREYQLNLLEDNLKVKKEISDFFEFVLEKNKGSYHPIEFDIEDVSLLEGTTNPLTGNFEKLDSDKQLCQRHSQRWRTIKNANEAFENDLLSTIESINNLGARKKIKDTIQPKISFFKASKHIQLHSSFSSIDSKLNHEKLSATLNEIITNYTHRNPLRRVVHRIKRWWDSDFIPPDTKTQKELKEIRKTYGLAARAA